MAVMRRSIFPTTLGMCVLEWSHGRVVRVQLPVESAASADEVTVAQGDDHADPLSFVSHAILGIQRHLAGDLTDLSSIPVGIELNGVFTRRVLEFTRGIPIGEVWTYGELARLAGSPGAARAVGRAMAQNPLPLLVPCHRVVASDGQLTGFSAPGGLPLKAWLLRLEGARLL